MNTNDEIKSLLKCSPEEKQSKITTLYEAIQFYQIGKFRGIIDNIVCIEKHPYGNLESRDATQSEPTKAAVHPIQTGLLMC